jgi:hypothetical protein
MPIFSCKKYFQKAPCDPLPKDNTSTPANLYSMPILPVGATGVCSKKWQFRERPPAGQVEAAQSCTARPPMCRAYCSLCILLFILEYKAIHL